jgi:hypothetical protein
MQIDIPLTKMTVEDMEQLEKLDLVQRLVPPDSALQVAEGQLLSRPIYKTDPQYGGHMLLFVNMNLLESNLNYHPGNEEVFLVNDGRKVKPCIFVFGLSKRQVIEEKIKSGSLSSSDFVAYDVPFNDPVLSSFTVKADTPHFEITTAGAEQSPYFWVGESADLPMIKIDMGQYRLRVLT